MIEARAWQGALVFNVTLTSGLMLRDVISHQEATGNYWDSSYWVDRSLYIGNVADTRDVLYTLSAKKVKMNSLDDLALLKEVELP